MSRSDVFALNRRDFLGALGLGAGSLTLGIRLGTPLSEADARPAAPALLEPNVYVSIDAAGIVTVVCHRSEMGQGVRTSFPMIIADELEAEWSYMRVKQATGDAKFGNQNTDGSRSVRIFFPTLRLAGATAREMLISAAAKQWKVPRKRLIAREHHVLDPKTSKKVGYGALVALARTMPVPDAKSVRLKKRSEFRYIGKSRQLVDGTDLTTGKATFGADVRLPNMLIAVIARPPAVGDEIGDANDAAALAIPGVKQVIRLSVVDLPSAFAPLGGVAVLATNTWAAIAGRNALEVSWKPGRHRVYNSDTFKSTLLESARSASSVARTAGDVDGALAAAAKRVTAEYYVPHLSQAPMEPPVALASVKGDRCEVWTSIQTPQSARAEVAKTLKIPAANVTINVTLLGGGFGRKSKPDFVSEAALLSSKAGLPVRVQWTREDDLRHGFFHTVSAQRVEGGLDAAGKVTAWKHQTAFPPISGTFAPTTSPGNSELGMGLTDLPFAIPNLSVAAGDAEVHMRIGWMRSVANIYHAFAVGSFVDELAAAAGRDPRAMWLELCSGEGTIDLAKAGVKTPWNYGETDPAHDVSPPRMRRVIEAACSKAGWQQARSEGRAVGLSAHRSFASYVATVIEVSGTADDFRIERVVSVIDAGQIVSRDRVLAQLEGAIAYGLSAALHGQITARDGQVEQSNFHDYKVLRMNEAPRRVDVDVIDSGGLSGGVGEPGMPPVAPALANALFALTKKRHRELPIMALRS